MVQFLLLDGKCMRFWALNSRFSLNEDKWKPRYGEALAKAVPNKFYENRNGEKLHGQRIVEILLMVSALIPPTAASIRDSVPI